jgi:DNA-binding MarR family transcriptional regulator
VTLPQYRVLVLIAARGRQRLIDLAEALDVNQSTASRMCDRLVAKRLVRRSRLPSDRRTVRIATTGRALVDGVTRHRRGGLARVLSELTPRQQEDVVAALSAFALVADEKAVPAPVSRARGGDPRPDAHPAPGRDMSTRTPSTTAVMVFGGGCAVVEREQRPA